MIENVIFDNLYWHDGVIKGFSILFDNASVKAVAKFDIYQDKSASFSLSKRQSVEIHFNEVKNYQFTFDADEIIFNIKPGNIAYAFSKDKGSYKVYTYIFFVGYLEVVAKNIEIINL